MKNQYLAHYLPHELGMMHPVTVWTGNPPEPSHDEEGLSTLTIENFGQMLKYGTPLLRPLSDLTKEIEHNGEKVVPIDWLGKNTDCTADIEFMEHVIDLSEKLHEINFQSGSYWIVQKLISWHFDVFGLIEKREAIDMNTIN